MLVLRTARIVVSGRLRSVVYGRILPCPIGSRRMVKRRCAKPIVGALHDASTAISHPPCSVLQSTPVVFTALLHARLRTIAAAASKDTCNPCQHALPQAYHKPLGFQ